MPVTARAPEFRYSIAILTTDELVRPDIEQYLSTDYDVSILQGWDELVTLIKKRPLDAVLLDIDVLGERNDDGIAALRELRAVGSDLVLVSLTRSKSRSVRLKTMAAGVDEHFVAPVDFQEIRFVLGRSLEKRVLEIENRQRQRDRGQQPFHGLIGSSEAMEKVYQAIERVAHSSTTVLLRGESGAGKELVARAIVAESQRRDKPFVSINCAALPEHLVETELFGHEKGAFTDARNARPGHIELAHTGTLFLDEIATLGLALQSKLLRVLEDRAVTRIGGNFPRKIDFRLITATNENLEEMAGTGKFREDLYYRINVIPIAVPSLRERVEDIPLLFHHFLRQYSDANHLAIKQIEPDVIEILEQYPWPGNVRELENLVQRLVLMVDGPIINVKHLPQQILLASTTSHEAMLIPENGVNFDDEMARIEAAYVNAALRRSGGSKAGAARLLHMDKQKMHYLCRKYRIGRD